ncbi:MAG: hypothetical protein R3B07_10605 [Polyangiaceae bacterium]
MARKKIALIGAGNIGGELANLALTKQLGDIVLFDIPPKEDFAKGKALDLEQASTQSGADASVIGSSNWEDCAGADVLIITAGVPRKPGQSRDDLVGINVPIIRNVADNAKKYCPDAFVIVISNPLDAMVYEFKRRTGFPAAKVVGMAGVLDSALQPVLAREAGVGVRRARDGARRPRRRHGAVVSHTTINGIRSAFVAKDKLDAIVARTRTGGGEIVADGHQRVLRASGERDQHGAGLPLRREARAARGRLPGGPVRLQRHVPRCSGRDRRRWRREDPRARALGGREGDDGQEHRQRAVSGRRREEEPRLIRVGRLTRAGAVAQPMLRRPGLSRLQEFGSRGKYPRDAECKSP